MRTYVYVYMYWLLIYLRKGMYAYKYIYTYIYIYLTIAKCCYIATCIVFCTKYPYLRLFFFFRRDINIYI